MDNFIKIILKKVIPLALIASFSVAADTKTIDEAVKRYYAGFPDEAISMMKPLALSGDVNAQYLLGNILYGLSKTKNFSDLDGPIKWYRMAAEQDSAAANYALGVIFYNKWRESRDKKEAATAIIYYQKAAELGYKKAQVPLNRIKSQSGISHQEAVALVKAQGTMPTPESESGVQASKNETGNLASIDTQTPINKSPAKIQMDKYNEPVAASKTTLGDTNQVTQAADRADDGITITVTLADIASQCQNYTETGFDLYAETIKGALFSGKATIIKFGPDSSKTGNYSVSLTNSKFGIVVFLDLHDVPKEVAVRFEEADKFGVRGLVIDSKAVGSNCAVSLIYQPVKG